MLGIDEETTLELSPSVLLRSVPARDVYYAFDISTGDSFRLNTTSFWILEAIGRGIGWAALREQFLGNFEVAREQGISDLVDTVRQFLHDGIVRRPSHERDTNETQEAV